MISEKEVRAVIAEAVPGIDASKIALDTSLFDAGVDSLDHTNILLGLQEQHQLVVPDEEADKLKSIQDILDYARRK